ncbi:hypothetical protein ACLOJK_009647 [Asimina triloba]
MVSQFEVKVALDLLHRLYRMLSRHGSGDNSIRSFSYHIDTTNKRLSPSLAIPLRIGTSRKVRWCRLLSQLDRGREDDAGTPIWARKTMGVGKTTVGTPIWAWKTMGIGKTTEVGKMTVGTPIWVGKTMGTEMKTSQLREGEMQTENASKQNGEDEDERLEEEAGGEEGQTEKTTGG